MRALNTGKLKDSTQNSVTSENEEVVVFCDASGAGFGGYLADSDGSDVIGCWSETECGLSSTWRELEAVYSKNPLNRTSTGPDKMSGFERIPVYRGFSY